jgi:hypothetical protein
MFVVIAVTVVAVAVAVVAELVLVPIECCFLFVVSSSYGSSDSGGVSGWDSKQFATAVGVVNSVSEVIEAAMH